MFVFLANFDILMRHTQKKEAKTTYAKAFIENKWPKVTKL
jgi:hypothetical protein